MQARGGSDREDLRPRRIAVDRLNPNDLERLAAGPILRQRLRLPARDRLHEHWLPALGARPMRAAVIILGALIALSGCGTTMKDLGDDRNALCVKESSVWETIVIDRNWGCEMPGTVKP